MTPRGRGGCGQGRGAAWRRMAREAADSGPIAPGGDVSGRAARPVQHGRARRAGRSAGGGGCGRLAADGDVDGEQAGPADAARSGGGLVHARPTVVTADSGPVRSPLGGETDKDATGSNRDSSARRWRGVGGWQHGMLISRVQLIVPVQIADETAKMRARGLPDPHLQVGRRHPDLDRGPHQIHTARRQYPPACQDLPLELLARLHRSHLRGETSLFFDLAVTTGHGEHVRRSGTGE